MDSRTGKLIGRYTLTSPTLKDVGEVKNNTTNKTQFETSGFGATNIKALHYTFGYLPAVTSLDLSWLESVPTYTKGMFAGDTSLKTIYP